MQASLFFRTRLARRIFCLFLEGTSQTLTGGSTVRYCDLVWYTPWARFCSRFLLWMRCFQLDSHVLDCCLSPRALGVSNRTSAALERINSSRETSAPSLATFTYFTCRSTSEASHPFCSPRSSGRASGTDSLLQCPLSCYQSPSSFSGLRERDTSAAKSSTAGDYYAASRAAFFGAPSIAFAEGLLLTNLTRATTRRAWHPYHHPLMVRRQRRRGFGSIECRTACCSQEVECRILKLFSLLQERYAILRLFLPPFRHFGCFSISREVPGRFKRNR